MSRLTYINVLMADINDLTDTIYESLVDNDTNELNKTIDILIKILKDVKKSHESNPGDIGPL
jgi:hypothetical protein